jgi:peroxiredoxin Q/BCP
MGEKPRELKIGDRAPEFTLPSDDGGVVSLSDFRGKRVVLYFFPKALTPG